jgi:dTDP-4-amino-4,6-dideoxygalactose transaminase
LSEHAWNLDIEKNAPLTRYPVHVKNRAEVLKKLKKQGIYAGHWYTQPVAPKGVSLAKMKYYNGTCPVAESVCASIINLPTLISKDDAKKIIDFMKKEKLV